MMCDECQVQLIGLMEGVLEEARAAEVAAHLETCAACRDESRQLGAIRDRLLADAARLARRPMEDAVMDRVLRVQTFELRRTTMWKRYGKAGLGLVAAAAIAMAFLATWPGGRNGTATAAEVMRQGIAALANLHSVYLKVNVRTLPADNFELVGEGFEFVTNEMWKEFDPVPRWRVEKAGRVVVMDGQSSVLLIKSEGGQAHAAKAGRETGFVGFLQRLLDVDQVLDSELQLATQQGWDLRLSNEQDADGAAKLVVTVQGQTSPLSAEQLKNPGLSPDWLRMKGISSADNRRVYRFDAASKRLEDVKVYVQGDAGEVLILEVAEIRYNPAINPTLFTLAVPSDATWFKQPEVLPDNDRYAQMTPKQAAEAFFKACAEANWDEVLKFQSMSSIDDRLKQYLGGLQVISIGEPFQLKERYGGWFVPYEIKLKFESGTKKWNLALRNDNPAKRWIVDGGF